MNWIIIACAVMSVAAAAVLPHAQILEYVNINDGTGNYNFRFKTTSGIIREETGTVVNAGQEDQYIDVHGSYSYVDMNGEIVSVRFSANKDGYHLDEEDIGFPEDHVIETRFLGK